MIDVELFACGQCRRVFDSKDSYLKHQRREPFDKSRGGRSWTWNQWTCAPAEVLAGWPRESFEVLSAPADAPLVAVEGE